MVKIKSFPAVVYSYNKVRRPAKIICPPYDIITSREARSYRNSSPYNMIHLTLPEKHCSYQKVASCFQDWLEKEILVQNKKPAIFFYQQEFKISKKGGASRDRRVKLTRLGFIACLSLKENSYIYGHEHTRIEPKEDRFKLLVQVQANLEPIFVLFPDSKRFLESIFKKYILHKKPLARFRDQEKNVNILWRLTNPDILNKIKAGMANKILFIADGHHRYEVSLNYQKRMRSVQNYNNDYNYIMAYFCPMPSSGLVIRPVYRLVRGINDKAMTKLKKLFYVQKISPGKLFGLIGSPSQRQRKLGMYRDKNFYILTLKNKQALNKIDKDYRALDVCLLNDIILGEILKVKHNDKQRVVFSADTQELIQQVDMDKTCLAFFVKPVRIGDVISLAKAGKKMPSKTTYFYPKVPSGLAIYKFKQH